jgi:phosphoenolpyruvate-protein kinase (PTS system EI component)
LCDDRELEEKNQCSYESLTVKSKDLNQDMMLRLHQSMQEHETLLRKFKGYQADIHAKVASKLQVLSDQTQRAHEAMQRFEKQSRKLDVHDFKLKVHENFLKQTFNDFICHNPLYFYMSFF